MYDFYKEKCNYNIAVIIVIGVLLFAGWLYHDAHRNDKQHNDTDGTMDNIEKRVDTIESGIDNLSNRITKTQKTVGKAYVTVNESRESAETIAGGVSRVADKLDSAVQRSGRITNLIADIEAANR